MSLNRTLTALEPPQPPLKKQLTRKISRRAGEEHHLNLNLKDELFPAEQLQTYDQPVLESVGIPEVSIEAQKFIKSLEPSHLNPLTFNEHLITSSESGDIGEFVISIDRAVFNKQECYLIIAKSLGYVEGVLCGTSFTAYVNSQLETLEQRHHEFVKVAPVPLDRKSLFVKKGDTYVYVKTLTNGNDTTSFQKAWRVSAVPAFILEGANILLVRALIHRKHVPADFKVASIDSDGNICSSDYTDLGASVKEVCKTFVPAIGLQRSIYSKENTIAWRYFLTSDGYFLVRQQVGSPVIMKVAKIPTKLPDDKDVLPEFIIQKKKMEWEMDMEMKSKFIDKKGQFMNNYETYLGQKPEVRSLLADFLQFLLLRKPDDVLSFAARYFSSFSTRLPTVPPFLGSTQVQETKVHFQQH